MTRQEIIDKIATIKGNTALPEKQKGQLLKIYEDKLAALKEEPKAPFAKFKEGSTVAYEGKTGVIKKSFDITSKDGTIVDHEVIFGDGTKKIVHDSELKTAKSASKPKVEKPATAAKTSAKKSVTECDELIEKEKERKKNSKLAAEKRAKMPKKTEATKGKEVIEKQTDKVAKRADKGLVSKSEIQKLIAEHKAAIKKLESLLSKATKMETGGTLSDTLSQEHSDEFHEIKEHHCGCKD